MITNKISDLIVFKTLKNIKHGFIEITNFEGEILKFGNIDEKLKAKIIILLKIHVKKNFMYRLLLK